MNMEGFILSIVIFILIGLFSNKSKSEAQKKQAKRTFDAYDSLTEKQPQTARRQNVAPRVAPKIEKTSADEKLAEAHSEENCGIKHDANEFAAIIQKPIESNGVVSGLFNTKEDCVKAVIYSEIMNPKFKNF